MKLHELAATRPILAELALSDIDTGYYDPSLDRMKQRQLDDTRKPKLFLKSLNKLKKMRALRKLEKLKRQDLLGIMYGAPDPDEAEAMGGMGGGGGFGGDLGMGGGGMQGGDMGGDMGGGQAGGQAGGQGGGF